ncbi:membrane protein [Dyella jiangningensis]|nr:membrane protein [Dyella jiangningensis]
MQTPETTQGITHWLDSYSADHQNPTNRLLHWICVPLILWCAIAMMWTIPVPPMIGRPGFWAVAALVLAFAWYWKQSHRLGGALLVALVLLCVLTEFAYRQLGPHNLLLTAIGVFIVAWIGQFIGHAIEGRRPSFFTDLAYLLVGPAWLMDKFLRRIGV